VLPAQRRDLLLSRLRSDGQIVAKDLAAELGLSEDSLRRDLRDLAAAGLCQRVYGGALPISPAIGDYAARQEVAIDSKRRVAARAAALVAPGSTVILDGGTTTLQVARALAPDLDATVVTHSPTIAAALVDHPRIELYLIGGRVFKHSAVTSGAAAAEAAAAVHADLFLLGVTGVHPQAGLTTGDGDEAAMKRALARRAADTYVLASSEKIGAASRFSVLPLGEVAGVVTDADPDHPALRELESAGVSIVSAWSSRSWDSGSSEATIAAEHTSQTQR
jgi:DeoR/GlpR family transcriptional regulator of sugar metabolism